MLRVVAGGITVFAAASVAGYAKIEIADLSFADIHTVVLVALVCITLDGVKIIAACIVHKAYMGKVFLKEQISGLRPVGSVAAIFNADRRRSTSQLRQMPPVRQKRSHRHAQKKTFVA
jgi:hypothetical protein